MLYIYMSVYLSIHVSPMSFMSFMSGISLHFAHVVDTFHVAYVGRVASCRSCRNERQVAKDPCDMFGETRCCEGSQYIPKA